MRSSGTTSKKVKLFSAFRPSPRLVRDGRSGRSMGSANHDRCGYNRCLNLCSSFFSPANLKTIAIQVAVLGVVTIGQTLVLLNRSIDMSVSAVLALGAVIVVQTECGQLNCGFTDWSNCDCSTDRLGKWFI